MERGKFIRTKNSLTYLTYSIDEYPFGEFRAVLTKDRENYRETGYIVETYASIIESVDADPNYPGYSQIYGDPSSAASDFAERCVSLPMDKTKPVQLFKTARKKAMSFLKENIRTRD